MKTHFYKVLSAVLVVLTPFFAHAQISGPTSICIGSTSSYTDPNSSAPNTVNYYWAISDTTIATIDVSGNVTGISAGTVNVIFVYNDYFSGYIQDPTYTVTVNATPNAGSITGTATVCVGVGGENLPLTDTVSGGVWSSSNAAVVGTLAGNLYVFNGGTSTISYSVTNECGSTAATTLFTANDYPDHDDYQIVGTICNGSNTAYAYDLGTSYPAAVWVSGNQSIATIDSASGVITGVSAGTVSISYVMVQGGCYLTLPANVNPLPNAGTISGTLNVSNGGTSTIIDNTGNYYGTWSSCNNLIATVNNSGNVNGIADGSTVITYSVSGICGSAYTTANVTVGNCTTATNISTFAGDHVNGYTGDDSAATAADMGSSYGVAADGAGNVYISDYMNNVVRMVSHSSGTITTIAGTGVAGYNGDGYGVTAMLNGPCGLAMGYDATSGHELLYIADKFNERIRRLDLFTNQITTIAGNGLHGGWNGASYGNGGPATAASLDFPVSVAVNCSGNMYIADLGSQTVRVIDPTGTINLFAGTFGGGYNGDGIPANTAQLNNPSGVAADCAGNVYIADAYNNRVRMVNAAGIITTIAGNGTGGYAGDGNPGGSAELWIPNGVTLDACGDLYIADWQNNVVRLLTYTPGSGNNYYISTFAGVNANDWHGYDGDGGPADSAFLYLPSSVAIDGIGNVYIADYGNYVVRAIGNSLPSERRFANGTTQNITACANQATPINNQLAIPDVTSGKAETWSVSINPAHGTLNGFDATASATAGTTTPTGLTYTPAAGYTGMDAFTVVINDGTTAASTTVNVNIGQMPNPGTITGGSTITDGNSITLADATGDANGVWSSNNDQIATVDAAGNVTAADNGIAIIYYTVTNSCGSNNAAARVVIDNATAIQSKALLFPNPNNGTFQCEFTSAADCQLEMTITDVTGRIVYTQAVAATAGANAVSVNLPDNIQRPSLLTVSLGNKNVKYPAVKITVTE